MTFLWCATYLGVMLMVGCSLLMLLSGGKPRPLIETLGIIIVMGAGATGTLLLWLSFIGIAPGRWLIFLLGLLGTVTLAVFRKKLAAILPSFPKFQNRWPAHVLMALIIMGIFVANLIVFLMAIGMPVIEWDSFAIWILKAKVLYDAPLTPRPAYFTDLRFAYSHLDYPLLLPMLYAGAFAMIGQADDQWGKIVLPLLYAGQTLLAYTGARQWLGRNGALAMALLLVGGPSVIIIATPGVADIPLAVFLLASLVYLLRWMAHRETADLLLAAAFTVFMAMTKSEGLALAAINLLAIVGVAAFRKAWKPLGLFSSVVIASLLPWLVWSIGLPRVDENYTAQITYSNIAQNLDRLGTILPTFFESMAEVQLWGGLWLVLPCVAFLGYRGFANSQGVVLWIMLLLHLSLYALIYVVTPWNLNELLQASLVRVLSHVAPNVMLLVALHWGSCESEAA